LIKISIFNSFTTFLVLLRFFPINFPNSWNILNINLKSIKNLNRILNQPSPPSNTNQWNSKKHNYKTQTKLSTTPQRQTNNSKNLFSNMSTFYNILTILFNERIHSSVHERIYIIIPFKTFIKPTYINQTNYKNNNNISRLHTYSPCFNTRKLIMSPHFRYSLSQL